MEPITTTIVTALTAGATASLTETAKIAVSDAYAGFKRLIIRKFGEQSPVVQAIQQIENKPASEERQRTLNEEIEEANLSSDPEIAQAIEALKSILEKNNIASNINIIQVNGMGAVGAVSGGMVTINNKK
jgi:hypothetical protein